MAYKLSKKTKEKGQFLLETYVDDGTRTEGTKYNKARAILGTNELFDPEKEYEFSDKNGNVIGVVSHDAKEAIEKNKLDSYKPKNDEEKRVIDSLLQESYNNSPYAKLEMGLKAKKELESSGKNVYLNDNVYGFDIKKNGDQYTVVPKTIKGIDGAFDYMKSNVLGTFNKKEDAEEYAGKLKVANDFIVDSKYVSTAKDNVNDVKPNLAGFYDDTGFEDIKYDYINKNKTAISRQQLLDIQSNSMALGLDESFLKEMTDDEIAVFNYIYKNMGKDEAYNYIDSLKNNLTGRQRQNLEGVFREMAQKDPIRSSVFTVLASPTKGISYLGQLADYLNDGKVDQNAGYNKFSYTSSATRDEVSKMIEDSGKWGKVGSWGYQLGMSYADMLMNSAVTGGNKALSLALMGAGAAADSVINAKDRGLSDNQAFGLGTISGAVEILTEKIGWDNLFEKNPLEVGIKKYIVGNMLSEGAEEGTSTLANYIADLIISKDKSEWSQDIKKYTDAGDSKAVAMGKAVGKLGLQTLIDTAGGALMGGVGSSGMTVTRYIAANNSYTTSMTEINDIIDKGLSMDENSDAYKNAVKLRQKQNAKNRGETKNGVSDYEIQQQKWQNYKQTATTEGKNLESLKDEVIKTGLESPKDSQAYKNAKMLSKKKNISDFDLGEQYFLNVEQTNKESEQKFEVKYAPKNASENVKTFERTLAEKGVSDIDMKNIVSSAANLENSLSAMPKSGMTLDKVISANQILTKTIINSVENKLPKTSGTNTNKITEAEYWQIYSKNINMLSAKDKTIDEKFVNIYAKIYSDALASRNSMEYNSLLQNTGNVAKTLENYVLTGTVPGSLAGTNIVETAGENLKNIISSAVSSVASAHSYIYGQNTPLAQQEKSIRKGDFSSVKSEDVNQASNVSLAMLNTFKPGAMKRIAEIMEKETGNFNIERFSAKLTEYYQKNGNINPFREFFTDGGIAVTRAMEGITEETFEETEVATEESAPIEQTENVDKDKPENDDGVDVSILDEDVLDAEVKEKTTATEKPTINKAEEVKKGFGEAGTRAYERVVKTEQNLHSPLSEYELLREFEKSYKDGFQGRKSTRQSKLSEQSVKEAEKAGKEDRKGRKKATEKTVAKVEKTPLEVADKTSKAEKTHENTTENSNIRYSIETIQGTDKRYVRAEEQVIKSKNSNEWEKEIFEYVNKVVRNGKDFVIPMDNEENIIITERTAWKLSDRGNFADDYYMVKGNASGVIDEIISVSKYNNSKPPMKQHSNGFAQYGFDYRTAYFMDLDGKYYKLKLSVGVNADGKEAYNIGEIKQVAIPSKRFKDPKGTTTSKDSITQKENVVNRNFEKKHAEIKVQGKGVVKWNALHPRQQKAITFMEGFAKAANMKLVFVANSPDFNGAYDISGDTMYLDIYAGVDPMDKLSDLIIPTASHELTHWMHYQAPEAWSKLSGAVFKALEEVDGISREQRIKNEMARLKGKGLTYNELVAEDEIVARACEDMLAKSEVGKKIFNSLSESEQKTITGKIKSIIQALKDWISDFLSSYKPSNRIEAEKIRQAQDKVNEILKLWNEGIAKSVEVSKAETKAEAFIGNYVYEQYGVEFDVYQNADEMLLSEKDKDSRNEKTFSYDELVAKGDLLGVVIKKDQQIRTTSDGSIDADFVVSEVKKKCESIKTKASTPTYYTNVPDIDRNVEITKNGVIHSFFSSVGSNKKASQRDLINARVSLEIPQILRNSIEVNRSKRGNNLDVPYSHVMMGTVAIEDNSGNLEYYAVRSVIEERANQNPILAEAKILGKLYAVNAKKIGTPNAQVVKNDVALTYDAAYTYNIAQFLNDVKTEFNDTFSEDVYKNMRAQRQNNVFSKNLLYSEQDTTDTEYVSAVENGDMETAQKMVDEAARKAGYTVNAYHGTPNKDFTIFDKDRVGKGTDQYGAGFYFASNKNSARSYGDRVIDSFISLSNPLKINGSSSDGTNLINAGYDYLLTEKQAYEVIKRLPNIYDSEESPLGDYYDSYWENGAEDWMIRDLATNEANRNIGFLDSDLFRNYPNELHEALKDVVGYDGVEVSFENGDKFYVAWFDNQMKSADPVTYDDKGNVIPLSERFNPKETDIRYSEKDTTDTEYVSAVENGDMETAQKMVDEEAKRKGYNSPKLYHGTNSFGFTEFDLSKMDDKRTIFLTNNKRIASTYSGVSGERKISDIYNKDIEKLDTENIAKELNKFVKEYYKDTFEFADYNYSYYNLKKLNDLINVVNDGLVELTSEVEQKIAEYANKIAFDSDDANTKIYKQLVSLKERLDKWDYNNLSTPIYLLIHHTDVFADNSAKYGELEANIRLMNDLRKNENISDGVVVEESLGRYSIEVMSKDDAVSKLKDLEQKGNYALYAKMSKPLIIDGRAQNWNNIRRWSDGLISDKKIFELADDDEFYYLKNKETGQIIKEASVDILKTSKMSSSETIDFLINKYRNILAIKYENVKTTREIAKVAKDMGYDSVVIKNITDNGGRNYNVGMEETADIYMLFNRNNVKSADPVTYDDKGNVIPLSERFNPKETDIRYAEKDTAPAKKTVKKTVKKTSEQIYREQNKALMQYIKDEYNKSEKFTPRIEDVRKAANRLGKGYIGDKKLAQEIGRIYKDVKSAIAYAEKPGVTEQDIQAKWNVVQEEVDDLAMDIVMNHQEKNDANWQMIKDLRDYMRGRTIKVPAENKGDFDAQGGLEELRKHNMGRFYISQTKGESMEALYPELRGMFGNLLPDISNPSDQLIALSDLYDEMAVTFDNPYDADIEAAQQSMSLEIMADMLVNIKEVGNDVKNKRIETLYKVLQTEREKRYSALKRVKDRQDRKIREAKAKAKEKAEKRVDATARQRLLAVAKRLDSLSKKSKPEAQAVIQKLIGHLDLASVSITGHKVAELSMIKEFYDRMKLNPDFIPDEKIEKMLGRLGKVQISTMEIEDVIDMTNVLLAIDHKIKTDAYAIESADKRKLKIQAEETMRNIDNSSGSAAMGIGKLADDLVTGVLTPTREARRITGYVDNDPLYINMKSMQKGQVDMFDYQMKAEKMFEKFTKDTKFMESLTGAKAKTYTYNIVEKNKKGKVLGDRTITITAGMRISLLLHNLNSSNQLHMSDGGVTIPNIEILKTGNIQEAYARGEKIYLQKTDIEKITSNLTEQEREYARQIWRYYNTFAKNEINKVSLKLKGYEIAKVKNYFPINTDEKFMKQDFELVKVDGTIEGMGNLQERTGSDVPIYLRDVVSVLDESIRMNSKYVGLAIPVRNMSLLLGKSFSKYGEATIEEQAVYGLNYTIEEGYYGSVMNSIAKKWGVNGKEYINKIMKDMQGAKKEQGWIEKKVEKIGSRYVRGILSWNPKVAFNQVASIPSAIPEVGVKALSRSMFDFGRVNTDRIAEYTPLQYMRSKGAYDTTIADMTRAKKGPLAAIDKVVDKVDMMTWTDTIMTRKLWKAAEYNIKYSRKDLKVGSQEYYEAVAELYVDIMQNTQPNVSMMERPQFLRGDAVTRMVMSFKGEPFKNLNMMYESAGNLRAKTRQLKQLKNNKSATAKEISEAENRLKQAKSEFAVTMISQALASLVYGIEASIFQLLYGKVKDYWDDEEEKVTFESWLVGVLKNSAINTVTQIPFADYVVDIVGSLSGGMYYSPFTPPALDSIDTVTKTIPALASAVQDLADGKMNLEQFSFKVNDAIEDIATFMGIPYANVVKNIKPIVKAVAKKLSSSEYIGDYAALKLEKTISNNKENTKGEISAKGSSDAFDILYNAMKNGDKDSYDIIIKDMIDRGISYKDIENAMQSRAKKDGNFDISKSLGMYAGVENQTKSEAYEKYIEKAEELGVSEDDLKTIVELANSNKKYQKRKKEAEAYIDGQGLDYVSKEFLMNIVADGYSVDELSKEQYFNYAETRATYLETVSEQIVTDGKDEREVNKIYNKAATLAEEYALSEASDGEYEMRAEWMNIAVDSENLLGVTTGDFLGMYEEYGTVAYSTRSLVTHEVGYNVKDYLEFRELTKDLKSDKDSNSKYIKGQSKQDKIINVLNNMDVSNEVKAYLYSMEYKSNKNNPWASKIKVNYKEYTGSN